MVALTGIEPAGRQFSSVQLGLSSCVFGLVQFATRAFTAVRMADVLPRCCPAARIRLLVRFVRGMTADQIVAAEDLWNRLPSAIVFDHMGHVPQPSGLSHPAFNVIRRLVDKGRTWVKLSVTNDNTKDGPPGYADITRVAQAYVKAAPERMVWGTNWPHPNETNKPDDAALFDLLAKWVPEEATRKRILVENPAALYGFPKA